MSRYTRWMLAGLAFLTVGGVRTLTAQDEYTEPGPAAVSDFDDFEMNLTSSRVAARAQLCSCCDSSLGCGDSCCDCGSGCCGATWGLCGGTALADPFTIDDDSDGVLFGGWIQQGYTSGSTGMFNNIPHRFNTHQLWLFAEKDADGSQGLDWGFRADIMYGIDSADTQAFGNNPGRWTSSTAGTAAGPMAGRCRSCMLRSRRAIFR